MYKASRILVPVDFSDVARAAISMAVQLADRHGAELIFLHVDAGDRDRVRLYFSAPAEAPTTRGFAAILATGLDEQPADDILGVPDDFYTELGLAALISPLRLRGMSAMLTRIKRRVRDG